jgi:peptidyl-dipeptidase Dcp
MGEVLDADASACSRRTGYSTGNCSSLRDNVLSRGGTENPMTLYKRFRGQEPTIDALLERNGITKS